ncbi:hypothetical protein EYF80_048056 [Liparis tanakae]|uniref:Uncharacterized protein n=1 Tax=Liparis tanakae TaxID=230148 RepID=A0A4Z2FLI7_9TELE|nr:hypothetical protein EYF80_048056 [Liparis tanakae]
MVKTSATTTSADPLARWRKIGERRRLTRGLADSLDRQRAAAAHRQVGSRTVAAVRGSARFGTRPVEPGLEEQ